MTLATEVSQISPASLAQNAQIFEYSKAANPIESGATPRIPIKKFSADLYSSGPSRIVPLDLSADLHTPYPATGPSLLAHFLRIEAGDRLKTHSTASSEFYFVIRGKGYSETSEGSIEWKAGDFLALPAIEATHFAVDEAALYMVNDSPLFSYLGARQSHPRFAPTLYTRESVMAELDAACNDPAASTRSRVSVLLANKQFEQTMTITHTLWTMFGTIAPGTRQLPHRHQSVALDFVVKAQPGVYTLVGPEIDADGTIKDPIRVDWMTGSAFVTPPGLWHEHVNESSEDAFVMPIQDAGLHTYLRTLDIQFYHED
ncbi:Gentisate 1,2-dioxygenase [Acidisarcina polymorpha]|uniref:Gentisate 1,2-dioxygenase n=1 Tax=Acidisarcina polymorpha TaxID=2211140 RepID=A0A2Z5G218_9BACT|nr:cupin domain-containing protein [Acidisarcina polymorpha]AXC12787.1 Gentisate 1,2-dioxygenase [Acidisarcina polymorpha]